ncbi:MAG: hypothetical protein HQK76_10800 [Desulfobacterales bacterium]|nr:hypothetical protein [Desulfobacterales bacterium]
MKNKLSKIMIIFVLVVINFIFFSCSFISKSKMPDESELRQKVIIEWDAKVNGEWIKVYDLATDSYKAKVLKDNFYKKSNVKISKYSIYKIEIMDSGKKASVIIDFIINQMGFDFPFSANEEWIVENGEWKLNIQPSAEKQFSF